MASLLLHGFFISAVANFTFPHLVREEKALEITLIEPTAISPKEIPLATIALKRNIVKTHLEPLVSKTISPKVILPEMISPARIVPAPNEQVSLAKNGTIFLLDASESMVVGLNSAKQILWDRLNNLPEKIPVNIAYFSNEVIFFSPGLFIWEKEKKMTSLAFFQKITAQGNLEMTDGLRGVLKRNPSRVILISDGLVEDKELAYKMIRKVRSEGVIIDTILIKRNPFEGEVLKRAAYLTGGNFFISSQTF